MSDALLVRLERSFAVEPDRVFDAWLDPEMLAAFLKPAPGVHLEQLEVDARVGGGFSFTMVVGETRVPIRGDYRVVERPHRLAFTWLSSRTEDGSLVSLTFEAEPGGGTRLTLEHRGFPDASARHDHDGGWATILEVLGHRLG